MLEFEGGNGEWVKWVGGRDDVEGCSSSGNREDESVVLERENEIEHWLVHKKSLPMLHRLRKSKLQSKSVSQNHNQSQNQDQNQDLNGAHVLCVMTMTPQMTQAFTAATCQPS